MQTNSRFCNKILDFVFRSICRLRFTKNHFVRPRTTSECECVVYWSILMKWELLVDGENIISFSPSNSKRLKIQKPFCSLNSIQKRKLEAYNAKNIKISSCWDFDAYWLYPKLKLNVLRQIACFTNKLCLHKYSPTCDKKQFFWARSQLKQALLWQMMNYMKNWISVRSSSH